MTGVEPFASQRVRFGIFAVATTAVLIGSAAVGRVGGSYLYTAAVAIVGSTLLDKALEWLQYPEDSPLPWGEGQQGTVNRDGGERGGER